MTHEPSAGFAADAYARVNGIGLVCVTYCVGGLNVLNAIAGAYAEKSPVVVVSGAPGRKDREKDPLLHHKVKTFETQRRVYDEVTVASTVLLDEQRAAAEIVRCVEACLRHKRPVYIEVPHDMADRQIPITLAGPQLAAEIRSADAGGRASRKPSRSFSAAKSPVILAGVEFARYRLAHLVVEDGGTDEHPDRGRSLEQERDPGESSALSRSLWRRDEQRRARAQVSSNPPISFSCSALSSLT